MGLPSTLKSDASSPYFEERLAALKMACARAGKPLTPQRAAVLKTLVERSDHPTADDIHLAVAKALPGVARATVYRTLEVFVDMGVAGRVHHTGVAVRYDPKVEAHHHFVCDDCGTIADVDNTEALKSVAHPAIAPTIRGYTVLFNGSCQDCSEVEAVRNALHH